MKSQTLLAFTLTICICSCTSTTQKKDNTAVQQQAQSYLDSYNTQYQQLYYPDELAQWKLNTRIVKGDTISQHIADDADRAIAKYTGSAANIDSAKKYLALKISLPRYK